MPTPNAARVGDPIKHSNALLGALTGLAIGIVVGALVAATILTGGLALAAVLSAIGAVCTFASAGYSIGKLLGSLGGSKSGVIGEGARTVFIGAGLPPAARALDKLACGDPPLTKYAWGLLGAVLLGPLAPLGMIGGISYGISSGGHAGAQIAAGSKTVYIEKRNAARVEDDTSCSGVIMAGAKTVGIGGEKVLLIPKSSWRPEVPQWLDDTIFWVDRVGAVCSLAAGIRTIMKEGIKKLARHELIDLGFTAASTTLLAAEEIAAYTTGRDSALTTNIGWVRTGVEVTGGTIGGVGNVRRLRAAANAAPSGSSVDSLATAAGRVDAPTTVAPRVDAPATAPRVDAPATAPRVDAPAATPAPTRPVPQGGQTIPERVAAGGNPPPYAEANPGAYYYDPVAGRYKRR